MSSPASSPYYLLNFERALAWIAERYDDLLDQEEQAFLRRFPELPQPSRAILVRMLMRQGPLFRASRLVYDEIGCPHEAAAPLAALGWVDADASVTIDELFSLATRAELSRIIAPAPGPKQLRKTEWLDAIRARHPHPQRYAQWAPGTADRAMRTAIDPLCDRLRLMFFGNLHQDWTEFVLADLGIYQYESVPFPRSARAFRVRADIDAYLALHACRAALETLVDSQDIDALVAAVTAIAIDIDNPWLETRRAKLLFRIGQHAERRGDWSSARDAYARSTWPGARHRRIRVLEREGRPIEARNLASQALREPESEAESQRVERMLPRLCKAVGEKAARPARAAADKIERDTLVLPYPHEPLAVEYVARDHLSTDAAPVFYVENGLINSLFGLLCWEAVFAPVPGAFFHPFQRGPADLHAPDFPARRAEAFARCLSQLDSEAYRSTVMHHFEAKAGIQSPFVFWGMLTPELVALALDCLPAAHLKRWFTRLLADIRENRSGLPDLIRFWPNERRYELIEVKGPGDKLQDNQIRWLRYCVAHAMPVRVLDVRWTQTPGEILEQAAV